MGFRTVPRGSERLREAPEGEEAALVSEVVLGLGEQLARGEAPRGEPGRPAWPRSTFSPCRVTTDGTGIATGSRIRLGHFGGKSRALF